MAIKDGPEYTRYVAQRLVRYLDTPRAERKQARKEARSVREHWISRWFGWAGFGLVLWWSNRRPVPSAGAPEAAGSTVEPPVAHHLIEGDQP